MSSLNPAWLIAEAVKTELDAAFADPTAILADADFGTFSPQSIAVIAPGAEDNRPGIGARSWVNIYVPEDLALTWETGNSYLAKPIIRVAVYVEETKRLRGSLHETCLSLSHFITVCLTRSTLNNVARRAPKQTGANTYRQKGETQTWVGEVKLEYEYQGRGAPVDWSKIVPDLAALTEAAATAAITAAGLTPDSDGAFSATVEKGLVISQSPAAGTSAYAGDIVTITVSFGVERNTVPVTAGLTAAAAEAALVAAGLVLGTSTTSMTDDTAAGLVASSSPEAGTGVAAGSAVDLVVSLGDRHTSIPFLCTPGVAVVLAAIPNTIYQWRLPDGTFQRADSPTYTASGAGEYIWIVMDDGHTVDELARLYSSSSSTGYPTHSVDVADLKYTRPGNASTGFRFQYSWCKGDLANLNDIFVNLSTVSYFMLGPNVGGAVVPLVNYELYGSVSGWVVKPLRFYMQNMPQVTGSVDFEAGATTAYVLFDNSTGFSYADVATTIINWDAANAGVFARTGIFNTFKRSLIGAANPAAEAAIVSLSNKGCSFTFLAE